MGARGVRLPELYCAVLDVEFEAKESVNIGPGARYRRLVVDGLEAFESSSVPYWAPPLEAKLCGGQEVALVGGGNSAGQAVVYLASHASKVWLLVRGPELAATMLRYLVDRIAGLRNVEVLKQTNITGLEGRDGILETIRWRQGSAQVDLTPFFIHRGRSEY